VLKEISKELTTMTLGIYDLPCHFSIYLCHTFQLHSFIFFLLTVKKTYLSYDYVVMPCSNHNYCVASWADSNDAFKILGYNSASDHYMVCVVHLWQ
jgi:hypothetical protein